MSPAGRVRVLVGAAAVAAAGIVAGVVLLTRETPAQPKAQCQGRTTPLIASGVPTSRAGAVRAAFALPGKRAALALEPVAQAAPKDPVVQFNYGVALFCAGYVDEAAQAFRTAKTVGRDTIYEMRADEVLHPQYFTPTDGLYPVFQQTRPNRLLAQGVLLQREGHQHSAERLYLRAARRQPKSDEAQVAAAVGRFDEDNLVASFSRLGPLVKRFPKSQSVRFHLGLLLAWTGQRDEAVRQFRLARALDPSTELGREAAAFLNRLGGPGTKGLSK
jgi:tetratricopeptide (TPR) repeat protein